MPIRHGNLGWQGIGAVILIRQQIAIWTMSREVFTNFSEALQRCVAEDGHIKEFLRKILDQRRGEHIIHGDPAEETQKSL